MKLLLDMPFPLRFLRNLRQFLNKHSSSFTVKQTIHLIFGIFMVTPVLLAIFD